MAQPIAVIVEDQANLAMLYEDALRLVGYNTISIRNGLEALNHLQLNDVPDLVILDVNLPGMSGRDILKHIRSKEKYASLSVIILTANSLMVSQIRKETSALDYLFVKPISMPKLQELAKSVQRNKEGVPKHLAKTQKVPHLDEHGNEIPDDAPMYRESAKTEPLSMHLKTNIETQEADITASKVKTQEHQQVLDTENDAKTAIKDEDND